MDVLDERLYAVERKLEAHDDRRGLLETLSPSLVVEGGCEAYADTGDVDCELNWLSSQSTQSSGC